MRNPSLNSFQFTPGDPGEITSLDQLTRYVRDLEDRVSLSFQLLAAGHYDPVYVAPTKPRRGDIRYASGPGGWNPGSGEGLYRFNGTIWVFLG